MNSHYNSANAIHYEDNELLNDYLDHLCAPLIGVVPYSIRRNLRQEAHLHVLAVTSEFEEKGLCREAALTAALEEHGEPWQIGQAFVAECFPNAPTNNTVRIVGVHMLHALAWFGVVSVLVLLLVERYALYQSGVFPEYIGLVCILAPFVAGGLTGMTRPMHPVPSVTCALMLHICVSLLAGLLLLPATEGLFLAAFEFLFWLPIGCFSAWISSHFILSYRRQRFLRFRQWSVH